MIACIPQISVPFPLRVSPACVTYGRTRGIANANKFVLGAAIAYNLKK